MRDAPQAAQLRAVLSVRDWLDAHLAAGTEPVRLGALMNRADDLTAPDGASRGVAALALLASSGAREEDLAEALQDIGADEEQSAWLRASVSRLRQGGGLADSDVEELLRKATEGVFENEVTSVAWVPVYNLAAGRTMTELTLKSDAEVLLRIREPSPGHILTAAMMLRAVARTYALCNHQEVRVDDAEVVEVRDAVQTALAALEALCAATGVSLDEALAAGRAHQEEQAGTDARE